jgi:hypothetical protein
MVFFQGRSLLIQQWSFVVGATNEIARKAEREFIMNQVGTSVMSFDTKGFISSGGEDEMPKRLLGRRRSRRSDSCIPKGFKLVRVPKAPDLKVVPKE